jgi:hypothetical protein
MMTETKGDQTMSSIQMIVDRLPADLQTMARRPKQATTRRIYSLIEDLDRETSPARRTQLRSELQDSIHATGPETLSEALRAADRIIGAVRHARIMLDEAQG